MAPLTLAMRVLRLSQTAQHWSCYMAATPPVSKPTQKSPEATGGVCVVEFESNHCCAFCHAGS